MPLAHKDMFYRRGFISTGGSKIQREFRPSYTATVLHKLDAAGAIHVGGLNMSEFASGPAGQNEHFGDCRNPGILNVRLVVHHLDPEQQLLLDLCMGP